MAPAMAPGEPFITPHLHHVSGPPHALTTLRRPLITHPHYRKDNPMGTLHTITPPVPDRPRKPVLRPLARLDVEQARAFVFELPHMTAGADLSAAMFLLGRLTEHAQALLDVVDATVIP
jgi:hypothetical protein